MHVESITPILYYHVELEKLHLNSAVCYGQMRERAGSVAEQQNTDLTRCNLSSAIHFALSLFYFCILDLLIGRIRMIMLLLQSCHKD